MPGISIGRDMYSVLTIAGNLLVRLLGQGDRGATAVEYGLIVALIIGAIAFALRVTGHHLVLLFTSIASHL